MKTKKTMDLNTTLHNYLKYPKFYINMHNVFKKKIIFQACNFESQHLMHKVWE
jgi:hypothetical protein